MNVEEPLPCPFCGNEVKSQSFWWHGCAPGNGPRGYYVFCLECSETDALDGPRRDTFEDAIAAWNRRTPPAMSADHIPDATNMVAPVSALSSKPVDDTGEANSSVKPPVDAVAWRERVALEIRNWPFDISRIEGCLELADAILDLIQSERAG